MSRCDSAKATPDAYASAENTDAYASAENTDAYASAENTDAYASAENTDGYASAENTDEYALAKRLVYDRLAERPRSRGELQQALAQREVPAAVAEHVLDRCQAAGLIDDLEFARSWIAGRQRGKSLARRALAFELARLKVSDEVARQALDEIDPGYERAAAERLVERKLAATAHLDHQQRTRRLVGFLARKGYPSHVAYDVVCSVTRSDVQPQDSP